MSATVSENQGNSQFASLLNDPHLLYGVECIRKSLADRGEPTAPAQSNLLKELREYFYRGMLRLSAASFSLKKDNSLPAADTAILEQDVEAL